MIPAKHAVLIVGAFALGACHGGDGPQFAAPAPTPTRDESSGGIWRGVDSDAARMLAVTTDAGRVHLLFDDGRQGFGAAVVDQMAVTVSYSLVTGRNKVLPDGSRAAQCTAMGTIHERQSIALDSDCVTDSGAESISSVLLTYDTIYDRDSSLASLAGSYNDFGSTLTIDTNGQLFEQNPLTGCVLNGQVHVIDTRFDVYEIALTISACRGIDADLNDSTFSGLAFLDNTGNPESLIAGLVGDVDGVTVAWTIDALSFER